MMNNHRVVLVTGASSGIGKCCAEYLSQQGHRVYGTRRRIESTNSEQLHSNTNLFQTIQMDVTDRYRLSAANQRKNRKTTIIS